MGCPLSTHMEVLKEKKNQRYHDDFHDDGDDDHDHDHRHDHDGDDEDYDGKDKTAGRTGFSKMFPRTHV